MLTRCLHFKSAVRRLGTQAHTRPPTAILLMNMGGPATLDQVEPFLNQLFSDKDLIPLPVQKYLAPWIAKRRSPKIAQQYAEIGGGSPIQKWTEKQGAKLCELLDNLSPQTAPHKHYIAFRYASPLTPSALEQMKQDGITRAIALTLYPQYSCSTTGSSLNELHRNIMKYDPQGEISWSVIDRWPTHPGLVEAFASKIRHQLLQYPEKDRKDVVLLFSAHSLPMTVVNRGDPYPQEVAATVQSVMENLGHSNPYRLIWQSQVGPQPWLGPKTDMTIEGYGKMGKKNLMIIPIAFVSDHIETLFEVDIEYGKLAQEHGVTGFSRCESLNDDPIFIKAMASLVHSHLHADQKCTTQLGLRCPGCTSEDCGKTKAFFNRP